MWATGPGCRRPNLLDLMRGASPVSSGASAELERLIATMQADPRARALLASQDDPGRVLAALRALDGGAGAAMSAYLDLVGERLLDGFDISEPRAIELPDVLLRAIRVAVERKSGPGAGRRAENRRRAGKSPGGASGRIRRAARRGPADVSPARRARRVQRHLGVRADAPGGARGRATARREGRVHDASDFVDAGFDEMCALLRGADAPRRTNSPPALDTAPRIGPRTRRHCSARRHLRRLTCPGCRRQRRG